MLKRNSNITGTKPKQDDIRCRGDNTQAATNDKIQC